MRRLGVWRHTAVVVAMLAGLAHRGGSSAQIAPSLLPPNLLSFVDGARRDINAYWTRTLPNYRPPAEVVRFQAPAMTDCGAVQHPNAFYCPATNKIYWDVTMFASQYRLGDFAPVFILAHEWGHLVQRQLGYLDTSAGLLTIQQELQADCLAGSYAFDAAQRKVLDPGDDDEAILSLRRAGDDLDSPWFDQQAHGSAGLRIDAFTYGFEGRACTNDAFWAFLRQRGVDPARAPQSSAPNSGRLETLLPRAAGRFLMLEVKRVQVQGAVDALKARYRSVDGMYLEAAAVAFPSMAVARSAVDAEIKEMIAKAALKEIRRTILVDEKDKTREVGVEIVLQGQLEYVVWSNRHVLGIVEGPFNVSHELYTALPF